MKRAIPKKNYFSLLGITLLTVMIVLYLAKWYNTTVEYNKNNSILSKVLIEINANEIENYLTDNPEAVIYAASSKDETIKAFEKQFDKLIKEENIKEQILYLDTSKEDNDDFEKIIKKISKSKIEEVNIPNLIYFEGNQVVAIMYNDNKEITKREVYNFLVKNGIIVYD